MSMIRRSATADDSNACWGEGADCSFGVLALASGQLSCDSVLETEQRMPQNWRTGVNGMWCPRISRIFWLEYEHKRCWISGMTAEKEG